MHKPVLFFIYCLLQPGSYSWSSTTDDLHSTQGINDDPGRSTILIDSNREPVSAIIIPNDRHYRKKAQALQDSLEKFGQARVPIIYDHDGTPKELLADRSIIALGNMASSRFIRTLYEQWYTLLDLKYPGPGGSVVRTLHDPYSTGHNVILIGGSDDAGVSQAVDEFSWRIDAKGKSYGYPPGSYFGWNPISTSAALYYMTGRQEYLDKFLELALPNPGEFPKEINAASLEGGSGKNSLLHPVAYWHHYTSHIFPLIWDLIEENPRITQKQRNAINSDLREHARLMEAQFNRSVKRSRNKGLSRHGLYYALNLYTSSRYFSRKSPSKRWLDNLSAVQEAMEWWLQHATWGEMDTIEWINTSIEPVFTYFSLAGHREFIDSGIAGQLLKALDTLWQGYPNEISNEYQSISLMHKAAWLLNDEHYAWLARQPDYDFSRFRIGQSWWPAHIPSNTPTAKSISIVPAATPVLNRLAPAINTDKGYQFLAWRSGYGADDDYLLLDGLNQGGRHPHHVAAITYLRHKDKPLLSGYENQLFVLRNGLSGNPVPRAAILDKAIELGEVIYIRTTVPDGLFATWQRHIMHIPGENTLVADKVTAKEPGHYELLRQWKTAGRARSSTTAPRNIEVPGAGRVSITTDKAVSNDIDGAKVDQRLHVELGRNDSTTLFSSLHTHPATGSPRYTLKAVTPNSSLLQGDEQMLIAAGAVNNTEINTDAAFSYLSPHQLMLTDGTRLVIGRQLLLADSPVSINWNLDIGNIVIDTEIPAIVKLAISNTNRPVLANPT
jgi:hypothetical protein